MRGKPGDGETHPLGDGLIPAHAGKTSGSPSRPRSSAAHPRSLGENAAAALVEDAETGSSPLTRGKRLGPVTHEANGRPIPAHAGKTPHWSRWTKSGRAHPRSRGENDGGFNWQANFPGSSPLTRGKLQIGELAPPAHGLIPAHAGKTSESSTEVEATPAHPRSRRENTPRLIFSIHP